MVCFTHTVTPLGGRNLVPNGSFEMGSAGWSSLGEGAGYKNSWAPLVENWGNFDALHGAVVKSGAAHGRSFLRIQLGGKHTPVFNFDYFEPVNRRELRPLAANVGWIEVTPGAPYTLSLDMRASRDGVQRAFGVQNEDAGKGWDGARELVLHNGVLTRQWKRYSHTFTPKHPFVFVLAGPNLTREKDVAVDVDAIQLEKGAQATAFTPRSDLEIGVMPMEPAGVFIAGKPATLKIAAFNNAGVPARAHVRFKITDFADQPVELPDVEFEVSAKSAMEKLVTLPGVWRGFYRVVAEWKSGDVQESRLLRVAIVPPRTTQETVLGINHAYPTPSLLALTKKAGVSWHRDWSLKWQHIEPARGQYHWEVSDPQINRIAAQRLNLMAMIPFPSTDWNSSAPGLDAIRAASPRYRNGGKGDDQELLVRARWAWPPRDVKELAVFSKTVVSRYKDQIRVWEFLNEPLFTTYSLPDFGFIDPKSTLRSFTVGDYLDLLRKVAPAIRAANPDVRVMGGPAMPPGGRYIQPMLEAGLLDNVDIFGLHDYPRFAKPETRIASFDNLLATMKAHGGPKPIWMTEFSYYGSDDLPRKPFVPIPGLWSEPQLLSEKQAADYIIRYCAIFLGRGGEKIFLHSGCTGSVNKPGTESCMFADGAVRKVFPAMAVFTEMVGSSPKFVADRIGDGAFIFAFETGKQAVLVLWDPDEKTTSRIPSGAACKDLMGCAVAGPAVSLTGSPVYFVGPPGQAQELLVACGANIQTKTKQ
ncbi:MAG: hypothetical protein NT105_13030 [Verrucomicrobia bacterium]|nr:hypothetical protein [Verrucomicrobiota bacterium]